MTSESGKGTYFVDLAENGGLGACDCPHFICILQPEHKETGAYSDRLRCKHIMKARQDAIELIIQNYLRLNAKKPEEAL